MPTLSATIIRFLVQIIFAAALPISLIFANVWYITNSEWLYSYNWWRNDIPEQTGISVAWLDSASVQIKNYFNNDARFLVVSAEVEGVFLPHIYNARETIHMADVKELIRGVRDVALWMGIGSAAIFLAGALILRGGFPRIFRNTLLLSGAITLAFIGAVLIVAAIDFNWIFTQFHVLSFTNDFWLLDPRDFLLRMFPAQFFLEATIFIAGLTVLNYIGLFILAFLSVKLLNRPSKDAGNLA